MLADLIYYGTYVLAWLDFFLSPNHGNSTRCLMSWKVSIALNIHFHHHIPNRDFVPPPHNSSPDLSDLPWPLKTRLLLYLLWCTGTYMRGAQASTTALVLLSMQTAHWTLASSPLPASSIVGGWLLMPALKPVGHQSTNWTEFLNFMAAFAVFISLGTPSNESSLLFYAIVKGFVFLIFFSW